MHLLRLGEIAVIINDQITLSNRHDCIILLRITHPKIAQTWYLIRLPLVIYVGLTEIWNILSRVIDKMMLRDWWLLHLKILALLASRVHVKSWRHS